MWFRKNKIKETKHYPYRGKADTSNYSVWDNMSFIEKFAIIGLPIGLTFIDYMMITAMFEFSKWLSIVIAIGSTILLMMLIWLFAEWMTNE